MKEKTKQNTQNSMEVQMTEEILSQLPTLSANIQNLLSAQQITQRTLHAQTGYSESSISKYVKGKQFPPLDFLFKVRRLYNVSIDDLIFKEIAPNEIKTSVVPSELEQEEILLCRKYCGTYLVYYLDSSNYKGRDDNSPEESLTYGILHIHESQADSETPTFHAVAILGIDNRKSATLLHQNFSSFQTFNEVEIFMQNEDNEALSAKTYYGSFELNNKHAFFSLSHDRKDKAMIITHRVDSNKKEYIGGMGTINSISKGREGLPTIQHIAFSRYPITLSIEEIHHLLLLNHPSYKADKDVKSLISLFQKLYVSVDDKEKPTELEKELMIKVNLERYVKESLKRNMFRYAQISNRDDDDWYKLLKKVSITDGNIPYTEETVNL